VKKPPTYTRESKSQYSAIYAYLTPTCPRIQVEYAEGACRKVGYLANVKPTTYSDPNGGAEIAALLLYFLEPSGSWGKAIYVYQPYFYLLCAEEATK